MPVPALKVVNDSIVPAPINPYAIGLTPREEDVRTAFFILGAGAPIVGALFALFVNQKWWHRKNLWSYSFLCALWFLTVSAFAVIVLLLVGRTASEGLAAAMLLGFVAFSIIFGLKDIGWVYFIAVILGGINDFLMPLLLFYGQQPILAIGSLGHVLAAALVFGESGHNYGIVKFNVFSFWAVWIYVGFIVAGLRLQEKPEQEYPTNPMKKAVPLQTFIRLWLIATVVSVVSIKAP
ncbi:hypothetical protein Clacol_006143 [Clathrus columnatus]|uniref:DUF4203 domain-containing protein n=1 Tax=Clathrus columnatus TaxID=1419009 RepID=A0AAV5AIY1_9AGAM|nr:hypothetical protein Clacol_006143 [Clathrus columnatus]